MDTSVFLSHKDVEDVQNSLTLIKLTKVEKSLLIILDVVSQNDVADIKTLIEQLQSNALFYLAYVSQGMVRWHQVITLNGRTKVGSIPKKVFFLSVSIRWPLYNTLYYSLY